MSLPSVTAVVNEFPAPSQTFILRKLGGLRDVGFPVTVAAGSFGPGADAAGFPLVSLTPWRRHGAGTPAWRAGWSSALGGLDRRRPTGSAELKRALVAAPLLGIPTDVLHFEFSGIAVSYLDALHRLDPAVAVAVSCRGSAEQVEPLRDPGRATALREVFDRAALIHCVSDDMARTVEQLGADPDRILVNRPAVPVADFAPLREAADHDGPLRIASIGRLNWRKGFDDALRALGLLDRRGVAFTYRIAGEGAERAKLTFLRSQLGLDDRVELLGVASQPGVRELLRWADVILLPSLGEGISNVVLEAMAAGRCVVVTDCGGMTEVVRDGDNGLVVPVGDPLAMADALESVARDPARRRELAAAGAAAADAELDLSRQIERFRTAYLTITGRTVTPGSG